MSSNIKGKYILLVLFFTGIVTRLPFLEKMQSHWDGPDYTFAILHYSLTNYTPTIPGYPLYIALGKFFFLFGNDPHIAILMVSVLFAGLGAVAFYAAGKLIFNQSVGIIASVLFLVAPTIYYFGITANPYGILPTTAVVIAMITYLISMQKKKLGLILGFMVSFAIGIRPQDAIFLLPLAAFGFIGLSKIEKYKSLIAFTLSFLVWFIPLINSVGELQKYFLLMAPFFSGGDKPNISLARIMYIIPILVKGYFLTLTFTGIFLLSPLISTLKKITFSKVGSNNRTNILITIFFLWFMPSFLFNLFIRSDHAAHQMTYLSAILMLTAYSISQTTKKYKALLIPLLILIISFNLYSFFRNRDPKSIGPYVSQSYHYSELIKNNIRLSSIESYIKAHYSPSETMLVSDPEIFRPVTYYLSTFPVYAYSVLDTSNSSIVNSAHYGRGWFYQPLVDQKHVLTVSNRTKHVIIIPNNKPYKILANNLRVQQLNGNAFIYIFDTSIDSQYKLSLHTIIKIK